MRRPGAASKRDVYEKLFGDRFRAKEETGEVCYSPGPAHYDMGLAPGGRMRQEIYDDDYGVGAWDEEHTSRCFVTIANSLQWLAITGERPPTSPPTARQYTDAGLPWFDYYDGDRTAISGSETLAGLKAVAKTGLEKGESPFAENDSVDCLCGRPPWGGGEARLPRVSRRRKGLTVSGTALGQAQVGAVEPTNVVTPIRTPNMSIVHHKM